ncbi:L,D-transpeptidase [Acetobacter sp. DsW_063]|uniref:L,D-transpeptidase n=1 Tax=Acetobacter sp. DsW_063 TaxID=1514894 RepID=UPI000A3B19C6|nr:L,D-transpeptidase [Acetobacter sp. DsW_063]OUJ13553.1 hypothetical protein HK28_01975 [Acetobacter sp. DsW_063]
MNSVLIATSIAAVLLMSTPALAAQPAPGGLEQPSAPTAGASGVTPSTAAIPAPATSSDPVVNLAPAVEIPPLPALDDAAARQEAGKLQAALKREVPNLQSFTAQQRARWVAAARNGVEQGGYRITRAQVLVVVDRNPAVQRLALVLALPDSDDWEVIGGVKVSTGTKGRKYYYITPTGVFDNTTDRLGYRAEGTKNENGIRGIGAKGMRVWDFGWRNAVKGWRTDGETGDIRLEMHATDPDFLERRLGHTGSEGCVRVPAAFNVFLDRHGLLDVQYEQAASYDGRFRALLRKDRTPSPIAGEVMLVFDSGDSVAPASRS